jgi:uncharacterized membrane protein YhaH (DUF805 family)
MHLLFGFNGRTRRLHYWLASIGAGFGLSVLCLVISLFYVVLVFWIGLAVQIKRWHDRDKSGVWVLIVFIPLVGSLWSLIECGILDGTEGPNRFGPSPKGVTGPPPVRV